MAIGLKEMVFLEYKKFPLILIKQEMKLLKTGYQLPK